MNSLDNPADDANYVLAKSYVEKQKHNMNDDAVSFTALAVLSTVEMVLSETMKLKKVSNNNPAFSNSMVELALNSVDNSLFSVTCKLVKSFVNNANYDNVFNFHNLQKAVEEGSKVAKMANEKGVTLKMWFERVLVGKWWTGHHCVRCGVEAGPFDLNAPPRERFCSKCEKVGFYGQNQCLRCQVDVGFPPNTPQPDCVCAKCKKTGFYALVPVGTETGPPMEGDVLVWKWKNRDEN